MSLSRTLLIIALLAAVLPAGAVGLHAARSLRDFEKAFVSGSAVIVLGAIYTRFVHDLDLFGAIHLVYLLTFVTLPLLLGTWFAMSLFGKRRRLQTLMGAVAAMLAVVGVYATHIEPNWLRVDRIQRQANVTTALRVAVIADLQSPNVGDHEQNAITAVIESAPDLVVIPGDWFQGPTAQIEAEREAFVDLLRQLVDNSELVVVTSGDSDHSIPLAPMVEEAGALFIDDTIQTVTIRAMPVRIAGLRVAAAGPERNDTLAALQEPTSDFSLLVAHRPDVVYELPIGADVDLIIAGHTHGGQVAIPGFGPPITFSDVPRSAAAGGLSTVETYPLYISTGVGLERLQAPQVRFGVRPSVAIIDLVPPGSTPPAQ